MRQRASFCGAQPTCNQQFFQEKDGDVIRANIAASMSTNKGKAAEAVPLLGRLHVPAGRGLSVQQQRDYTATKWRTMRQHCHGYSILQQAPSPKRRLRTSWLIKPIGKSSLVITSSTNCKRSFVPMSKGLPTTGNNRWQTITAASGLQLEIPQLEISWIYHARSRGM